LKLRHFPAAREALPVVKGSLFVTGLERFAAFPGPLPGTLIWLGWTACISQTWAATKRKFITFRGGFFKLDVPSGRCRLGTQVKRPEAYPGKPLV